ncbi:MAG: hypothetical protein ACJ8CR_22775 [Roseiflexaceae bacterium]
MFLGLFTIVPVLLVLLIVVIARRRQTTRLKWAEIGTIIDRSLRAYRRNLVPLLALAAICAPIGVFTYGSILSLFLDGSIFGPRFRPEAWLDMAVRIGTIFLLVMGSLGLGKALLACGVAQAIYDDATSQPVGLGRMLSQQPWNATLGLMLRMIVPSLINAFLGYIGALLTLSWRVVPTALIFERLGARDAVRQGRELVKPCRVQLADALIPLWLIGWLIAGAPLLGGFLLLNLLFDLSLEMTAALTLIGGILGNIFVAPLMALGATQFYLYVRERSLEQAVQRFTASGDALPRMGSETSL